MFYFICLKIIIKVAAVRCECDGRAFDSALKHKLISELQNFTFGGHSDL